MRIPIAVLGSTGSIGEQTLDIVRENPDRFEIVTLTANNNWQRLAAQAQEFDVDSVVIANTTHYESLKEALRRTNIKVYAGSDAVEQCAESGAVAMVINALVGYSGLRPTLAAVGAGKRLALANKESLVVGGELVMSLSRQKQAPILPIDSEHSAIFQCLMGESSPIRRLILTCSGGALRDIPRSELDNITPEMALKHPQWSMGKKITIDSATLVNKGFEVIEAHWLFGLGGEKIDVIIHPQAIVHSMVEFEDGAIKAQLGSPDMHIPISLAMMFPQRAVRPTEHFSFLDNPSLSFAAVDRQKYPALDIAYDCLRRGGSAAGTMNGANEVAVEAFLKHRCRYIDIVGAIEYALKNANFFYPKSADDYAMVDEESRRLAKQYLKLS